ncbi:hypothetical protein KAFR_0B06820 [Kazachstania africana CBS 2517]|uniref:ATP synthase subunit J, mitochondrial n=1 Tax=Kazachstania africana (strain ATCC 22294 / BCRC 22015 / CBS 2517 / CECT 1963 / NBRC 1671 / NRRL Y-8276) TaxID=1071382 RepID=H2ARH9_KAZAF|nr:hypothetical protein KAFR_0B06820 [Kazachstania africana CBS 2517]CCF56979.1 hypothetical protein KAFR_0B06820 [Kazachstania africana CBS 2517]
MLRRYSTPILKPYWPFFLGGAIVYYGMSKFTTKVMDSDEYINDPRHPRFNKGGKLVDLNAKSNP